MAVNYKSFISKERIDREWDMFVSEIHGVHFEQTSGWAIANEMRAWNSWRFYLKAGGDIVAGVQIAFLKYPLIGRIGLVIQGPIVKNEDLDILSIFITELKRFLKKNGFFYVAIVLPYKNERYYGIFQKKGLIERPYGLPPTAVVEDTLYLDFSKDIKRLWKEINSGRRRNITKGLKVEPVFREGTREDIKTFHDLMLTMCDRRQTEPTHKNVEFFYRLWDNLAQYGWFKVFLLEYENRVVCALVGFSIGDTFRYWKWGWSGEYPKLNLPSVLIWKTIEWAKENGFRYFDFVQVDRAVALAMKEQKEFTEELKNRSFSGPTQFKMRFGGDLVKTPGIYVLFRNSAIKFFVLKIGVSFLNSKGVNRLIGIVRNRSIK